MWSWIPSDEAYLNRYHDALSEIVGLIDSGEFKKEAGRVHDLILPYIEKSRRVLEKDGVQAWNQREYKTLLLIHDYFRS